MKIMVTGGCGFIGSNFIQIALEKIDNVEILNIDKLSYAGNLENLESIYDFDNYQFLRGDICDLNFLIDAFDNFKPSKILHLLLNLMLINPLRAQLTLFIQMFLEQPIYFMLHIYTLNKISK